MQQHRTDSQKISVKAENWIISSAGHYRVINFTLCMFLFIIYKTGNEVMMHALNNILQTCWAASFCSFTSAEPLPPSH